MKRAGVVTCALIGASLGGCLAGCSDDSKPAAKATPHTVTAEHENHAAGSDVDVRKLTLSASELRSESTWGNPRIQLDWPTPQRTPKLADALETQVQKWRQDFTADAMGTTPTLTVSWEPVTNADGILGIRLIESTFAGADVGVTSVTFYGDTTHSWTSMSLLAPGSTSALQGAVQKAVAKLTKAGTDWPSEPADVFTDITFDTNGDMLIHIDEGVMGPMSAGPLVARIPNPQVYLTPTGLKIRAAAMISPKAPTAGKAAASSEAATPPTSQPSASTVDCATTKCIALTFDDAPGRHTARIVKTLQEKGAQGTFFMEGAAVTAAPGAAKQVASAGMSVGALPWGHSTLTQMSPKDMSVNVERTKSALAAAGVKPVALRPPYGEFSASSPHAGLPFVLWNVYPGAVPSADVLVKAVTSQATPGAIVRLDENVSSVTDGVGPLVDALKKQGYTLVTVDQLIPHPDASKAYFSRTESK